MAIPVIVVCEGRTEERFVGTVLAPHLLPQGVVLEPRQFQTSPGHGGGGLGGRRVISVLADAVIEQPPSYVTTLFDLYRLPKRFPGVGDASLVTDPLERAVMIENALRVHLTEEISDGMDRFFAHVQPYEFESLLFAEVLKFAEMEPDWKRQVADLEIVVQEAESPEHINDGDETHPSARLEGLGRYKKVVHGPEIAKRIGVERIRQECRHFDGWVRRLEALIPLNQSR